MHIKAFNFLKTLFFANKIMIVLMIGKKKIKENKNKLAEKIFFLKISQIFSVKVIMKSFVGLGEKHQIKLESFVSISFIWRKGFLFSEESKSFFFFFYFRESEYTKNFILLIVSFFSLPPSPPLLPLPCSLYFRTILVSEDNKALSYFLRLQGLNSFF